MNIQISRLITIDDSRFKSAWELYQQSFPTHEQRSLKSQEKAMRHVDCYFEVMEQNDSLVGLLIRWETKHFNYIEHFCVAPNRRGKGEGSYILSTLKDNLPIILEIDPPETDIAKRRLAFYQRAGFVQNPYIYLHPPYQKEGKAFPLEIMT